MIVWKRTLQSQKKRKAKSEKCHLSQDETNALLEQQYEVWPKQVTPVSSQVPVDDQLGSQVLFCWRSRQEEGPMTDHCPRLEPLLQKWRHFQTQIGVCRPHKHQSLQKKKLNQKQQNRNMETLTTLLAAFFSMKWVNTRPTKSTSTAEV